MLFRHAWKELLAEPRFALLFIINLSLGLSGLITMEAFRHSLAVSLQENARNLLSADLAVSSRRPLTQEEISLNRQLGEIAEQSTEVQETFSMVAGPGGARLVLLKAVGAQYPLRGFLDLANQGRVGEGQAEKKLGGNRIWIEPDLARQLQVEIGSTLQLGQSQFVVDDFLDFDPTQSFRGMAMAGRILLSIEGLNRTALIRPESTVSFVSLYRFSGAESPKQIAQAWNERFPDPAVRVRSAEESAEDSNQMLGYLGDFLGLAALVALFLSALGAAYLFRTWLVKRSRVLAVHQVLGLKFSEAAAIPAIQAILLSLVSVPLALALGRLELSALEALIRNLSPVAISANLSLSSVVLAFTLSSAGAFFLALPFLISLRSLAAKDLLAGKLPEPRFGGFALLFFLPAAALLFALSVYEAQSFRTAGIFFGALIVSLGALLVAGILILKLLGLLAGTWKGLHWPFRQALLQLSRKGFNSLSAFVALALGALLLNLLPQLRAGLMAEMESPDQKKLPSLFLFDIQEEQLDPLQALLKERGLELENVSPLVRARLLEVNGETFERATREEGFRTREEEREARFRNRGINLTYRAGLNEAETLVSGKPFSESSENQLSLEFRFADRLGLKVGDLLLFDVQGLEIPGRVVNLRKVKWTSFQPNFFVLFQEGVIDGAPKMFLSSLRELSAELKEEVQTSVAGAFPNISVIDVRATVNRVLDLADRMRWSLNLMSAISLFAGFVVLFSIANRQAELRRWDMNLCKVLGAGSSDLRLQQLAEFGILSFAAGAFGAVLSVAFSWVASYYLFEGVFPVAAQPIVFSIVGTTVLGLVVSWLGARSVWKRSAAELLQEQPL